MSPWEALVRTIHILSNDEQPYYTSQSKNCTNSIKGYTNKIGEKIKTVAKMLLKSLACTAMEFYPSRIKAPVCPIHASLGKSLQNPSLQLLQKPFNSSKSTILKKKILYTDLLWVLFIFLNWVVFTSSFKSAKWAFQTTTIFCITTLFLNLKKEHE